MIVSIYPQTTTDGTGIQFEDSKTVQDVVESRIARYKTTDGGVAIDTRTFCHGDRNLKFRSMLSPTQHRYLFEMFINTVAVNVSIDEGVFSGVIKSITPISNTPEEIYINIMVKDKLSE
jgi:hypothetical protein